MPVLPQKSVKKAKGGGPSMGGVPGEEAPCLMGAADPRVAALARAQQRQKGKGKGARWDDVTFGLDNVAVAEEEFQVRRNDMDVD